MMNCLYADILIKPFRRDLKMFDFTRKDDVYKREELVRGKGQSQSRLREMFEEFDLFIELPITSADVSACWTCVMFTGKRYYNIHATAPTTAIASPVIISLPWPFIGTAPSDGVEDSIGFVADADADATADDTNEPLTLDPPEVVAVVSLLVVVALPLLVTVAAAPVCVRALLVSAAVPFKTLRKLPAIGSPRPLWRAKSERSKPILALVSDGGLIATYAAGTAQFSGCSNRTKL
jgi:hypothetical protein